MTRLATAAAASVILITAYSLSPLVAVTIAAVAAAALTAAIALSLRQAEREEIDHVMDIVETCVASERSMAEPVRLVS
jgi:hypothetical protein